MALDTNDINKKVEEQSSFGSYIAKDLKTTAMLVGGTAVGAGVGLVAVKVPGVVNKLRDATRWIAQRLSREKPIIATFNSQAAEILTEVAESDKFSFILPVVGASVGSFAAAVPHTYEHWREAKRQQLRVEEMGNDVIAMREQRNAATQELHRQAQEINDTNDMIKKIISQGPQGFKPIALNGIPENKASGIEQSRENVAEVQRG